MRKGFVGLWLPLIGADCHTDDFPNPALICAPDFALTPSDACLGRLFRRRVGLTPMRHRRRFATLRDMLTEPQNTASDHRPRRSWRQLSNAPIGL
jgi:hypothetical protein